MHIFVVAKNETQLKKIMLLNEALEKKQQEFDQKNDPHTTLNKKTAARIEERDYDRFWEFTDLSTLEYRMKGKRNVSADFKSKEGSWVRALYIRIGYS